MAVWNPYELVFSALYLWGLRRHGAADGPQYNAVIGLSFLMLINLTCVAHILERWGVHGWKVSSIPEWLFPATLVIIGVLHYLWILRGSRYAEVARKVQENDTLKGRAEIATVLYGVASLGLLIVAWSV